MTVKNLVAMMMESAGLTIHNLRVDIDPQAFADEIGADGWAPDAGAAAKLAKAYAN